MFINPPSGMVGSEPLQGLFLERALKEVAAAPTTTECLLLLKAAVGQRWFGHVFAQPHCWLAERAAKKGAAAAAADGGGKGPRGMVVAYVGRRVQEFCTHFGELGHIPGLNAWSGARAGGAGRE